MWQQIVMHSIYVGLGLDKNPQTKYVKNDDLEYIINGGKLAADIRNKYLTKCNYLNNN